MLYFTTYAAWMGRFEGVRVCVPQHFDWPQTNWHFQRLIVITWDKVSVCVSMFMFVVYRYMIPIEMIVIYTYIFGVWHTVDRPHGIKVHCCCLPANSNVIIVRQSPIRNRHCRSKCFKRFEMTHNNNNNDDNDDDSSTDWPKLEQPNRFDLWILLRMPNRQ